MSELFERIKTRRASGDNILEGIPDKIPSTGMEGRGGVSQDLGWGITRLGTVVWKGPIYDFAVVLRVSPLVSEPCAHCFS